MIFKKLLQRLSDDICGNYQEIHEMNTTSLFKYQIHQLVLPRELKAFNKKLRGICQLARSIKADHHKLSRLAVIVASNGVLEEREYLEILQKLNVRSTQACHKALANHLYVNLRALKRKYTDVEVDGEIVTLSLNPTQWGDNIKQVDSTYTIKPEFLTDIYKDVRQAVGLPHISSYEALTEARKTSETVEVQPNLIKISYILI